MSFLKVGFPSAAVLAAMISTHILVEPTLMLVEAAENFDTSVSQSGGGFSIGVKKKSREVTLLDGNLTLDLYTVPVVGSEEAPHVLVDLFDYACPSCRELHKKLVEFQEKHPGKIVVVSLPVPWNPACNPHVRKVMPGFQKSCEYARMALAVADQDREKFKEFHHYLLDGGRVPSIGKAQARAEALIGKDALAAGMNNRQVGEWIQNGIGLYQFIKGTTIPKLIVKDKVISYSGSSRRKIFSILEDELGLAEALEK